MRSGKDEQIRNWCNEHNLYPLNIRNMKIKCGRTIIVITLQCEKCGERYDRHWGNLQKQKFPYLCTKCAHKEIQNDRRLTAQKLIDMFAYYGYKVLTPIDKIKPAGKSDSYNKSIVTICGSDGVVFDVCWNNFHNRLDYYLQISNGGYCAKGIRKSSSLEEKVECFLNELDVPYKQEFKFSDCRGDKRMLPFDFCLYYNENNKLLIEVDGERHFKDEFLQTKKNDKRKDFYCNSKNIPLLRLPYYKFDTNEYKLDILHFINTNMK